MSFGNLEHWFINMKILIFSALYLLVQTSRIFAQSDSLAVSKANWIKEKIAKGVLLKTFCFNNSLFSSNQNISILEIKQNNSLFFDLGYDSKKLIKTSYLIP